MNQSQAPHPESAAERPAQLRASGLTAHRPSLPALTGLRFFASAYVVLFHSHLAGFLAERGWRAAGFFFANGSLAVLLFFLLSGFILSYTYEAQIRTQSQMRRFWEARYSRIWPLYAFSLLLSTLVYHSTPRPAIALATLLMVQAWNPFNPEMAGAWNYVCWTLSTEALFYAIFPFLQRWLERRSSPGQIVVLASALLFTVFGHTGVHGFGYAPPTGIAHFIPLAVFRIPDFVVGVCLGNLYLRRDRLQASARFSRWSLRGPTGIVTAAAALASIFLLCHAHGWWTSFLAISFALLLLGLASERSLLQRFLASKPLLIGGQISYAMYLLQWCTKMAVNQVCDRVGLPSANVRFLLDLALLLVVSAACFYGVEDPGRKYFRKLFSRLERRSTHPEPTA